MAWTHIIGHEFVKRLWQAHLQAQTVAPAYLLVGPEGIGKRRLALEMAKALNCLSTEQLPCDVCPPCQQITKHIHPDVHVIVPSGASDQIKIESIRQLISRIALRPYSAKLQVVLIDGAERLTEEAANSLLKSLEEPPAHTRFMVITSQLSHCLPTIVSRCQLLRCHPLPAEAIARILLDMGACESSIAQAIARGSGGSVSRALALAQQWKMREILLQRFAHDSPTAWLTHPLPETRQEVLYLLESLLGWLRDLSVAATTDARDLVLRAHEETLRAHAQSLDVDRCIEAAFGLLELRESLEQFVSPRLVASLAREHWLSLISV